MFNIKKALLSTLIISALAVQTTQPIDFSWITSSSIYQQGTQLYSHLNSNKNVILATTAFLISTVLVYKLYSLRSKQEPITDKHVIQDVVDENQADLNDRLREELQKILDGPRIDWSAICELINFGADVNTATEKKGDDSSFGWTALHLAVSLKNIDIINFLLNNKANHLQENSDGTTPASLAYNAPFKIKQLFINL